MLSSIYLLSIFSLLFSGVLFCTPSYKASAYISKNLLPEKCHFSGHLDCIDAYSKGCEGDLRVESGMINLSSITRKMEIL